MQPIRLMPSTFFNEMKTKQRLCDFIMASEKLSMGEQVEKWEDKFAQVQERKFAVAFNSGSSANLALLQALMNLGWLAQKDSVGFSAVTWATNPMPIMQLGMTAVPVDVNVPTLNIDSHELLKTLESGSNLKALFITNLLGFCSDLEKIAEICEAKGIVLIEDNCESFGSRYQGKLLGNFGLASTFSTFVGHHLSTIEGGIVCTDNVDLRDMLKMVRAHGWGRNLSEERKNHLKKLHNIDEFYDRYCFFEMGYNLRPTEINGFLGVDQIDYSSEIVSKREKNFKLFAKAAETNRNITPLAVSHMDMISNFAYPVIARSQAEKNRLIKLFTDAMVEIRPIVGGNMTEQPFFKKAYPANRYIMPNSQLIHDFGFYFPNFPEMNSEELDRLCSLLC